MNNLTRAIRMALKYKYSLMASIACSALVAVFWGANITTVYPFVKIVFQGQTLQQWVDGEIGTVTAELEGGEHAVRSSGTAVPNHALVSTDLSGDDRSALEQRLKRLEQARTYIQRFAPRDPFNTLVVIVGVLLVGTFVKGLFRVASVVLVSRAAGRTTTDIRCRFFRALLNDRRQAMQRSGEAAARVGADVASIGNAIQTLFGSTVQEPLKMLACLAGAAAVNWRLLIVSLLACPLASLLLVSLARSIRRASLRAFDQRALMMGRMLQTSHSVHVVKAYNMESHERVRFWQHALHVYREQLKINIYGGFVRVNNELLGIMMLCLSALVGGYLVLNQQTHLWGIRLSVRPMDFGQIMLFYAFLIGCTDPLRKLADVYGSVQGGAAAADRIMPFLFDPPIRVQRPTRQPILHARFPITFENVQFHYQASRPVLRGVSFQIQQGETLAIVGPNGCGKTTLINLLLRFLNPTGGRILLGDIDLREIRPKDLRRRMALVTQRPILFNDTVFNNIRYGTRQATREQVIQAARKAHAHQFIMQRLANGYETECGEGGRCLSGGQQQRLTLARAILRDPDILILDEASSQIDPKSENLIRQSLRGFIKNRTTIMITHRMATVELADRILVMDGGQILDLGTHEELWQRCPLYRSLRQRPVKRSA